MSARYIVACLMAASLTTLIMGAVIFGLVWLSGGTFGQRCAVQHEWGSPEHEACVDRLATRRRP